MKKTKTVRGLGRLMKDDAVEMEETVGKKEAGRRYVYHDVIRLGDAEKLMDCGFVQLQHIVSTGVELSKYLHKCEHLTLLELGLDDRQITPDSILEPVGSLRTESGSSGGAGGLGCPTLVCTATTEIVRKKRSAAYRAACLPVSEVSMITNRRKGTPHRSPLY
ncbi:hypothetical protein LguiA_019229 [Lonicera macranthoides]